MVQIQNPNQLNQPQQQPQQAPGLKTFIIQGANGQQQAIQLGPNQQIVDQHGNTIAANTQPQQPAQVAHQQPQVQQNQNQVYTTVQTENGQMLLIAQPKQEPQQVSFNPLQDLMFRLIFSN